MMRPIVPIRFPLTVTLTLAYLVACLSLSSFAQFNDTKKKHSLEKVTLEFVDQKKYGVEVDYYTIRVNINEKYAIMFYSDRLKSSMAAEFAQQLHPYSFKIMRKDKESMDIKFILEPAEDSVGLHYSYLVTNPNTRQSIKIPSKLMGDITEHRVEELMKRKWDTEAKLDKADSGVIFYFNNRTYKVIPINEIKSELMAYIEKYKLYNADTDLFDIELEE